MSKYKNKAYTLRIDNDLRLKIEYIAKKEDRTIKAQYERIVRNFVDEYESTNGPLIVEEDGTVNQAIKGKVQSSEWKSG